MTTPDPIPTSDDQPHSSAPPARSAPPAGSPERRVWRSDELFGDENEVLIQHGEMLYRLRQTRNGKLILHK